MKALIFAAGRGTRMRPLTDSTPKPLLQVGGKPLIVWHLEKLAAAGVREVVINTSHLAEQFPSALGDGTRWNLRITYSHEGAQPLETGGGLRHALPLLGEAPFITVNGDIWTDFDYACLPQTLAGLAHLMLVPMPAFRTTGPFERAAAALLPDAGILTMAGISVLHPRLVAPLPAGACSIVPTLTEAIRAGQVSAEMLSARWFDIGTPERLAQLDAHLRNG